MKNGYFQLICSERGTAVKFFKPEEGGVPFTVRELMEYLVTNNVSYDTVALNKNVQDFEDSEEQEAVYQINIDPSMDIRESYHLAVSQDKMMVVARFYPPSQGGGRMTAEEFKNDLALKKIVHGVNGDKINAFFRKPIYCADIIIAKGTPPRHGTDARIEYFFNTDVSARPTLNEDGSVDFFNLNTISHCKEGDVLAQLYPEDRGEYGYSVFGERIRPRDVKRLTLRYGHNINISEDLCVLTAATSGHVSLVEGKVFVSNVYEVENVDNSTGNITYDGSVLVNGNVCTNFSVKASGNIEVKGVVEGATLEAGGDVIITRGMNGMAKGVLKADGNVISKFIENSRISAGGYVSTNSILHSEVSAGTEILVGGKKGFITGGRVSAASLIKVKTLGSPMGADTIVEVGTDPRVKVRIQQLQKEMTEFRKEQEQIHPVMAAMKEKMVQGIKLRPEQLKTLQEMLQRDKFIAEQMEKDMEEFNTLQERLEENSNARVEVSGDVYSGTKICISDVSMVVKSSMSYCRFVKERGDVKMTSL